MAWHLFILIQLDKAQFDKLQFVNFMCILYHKVVFSFETWLYVQIIPKMYGQILEYQIVNIGTPCWHSLHDFFKLKNIFYGFIWWLSVNHLHNFTWLKMNLQRSTHTHPRLGICIYTHVDEKFYTYTVNMFKTMYMQNIRMHLSHPYIPMCGEGSHDETCKISKHYTHGIWSQQQIWCINTIYTHKHY